jgi:hypothetical protein
MLESAQIAVDVCAARTRARIGISIGTDSYLALNWQRPEIRLRDPSGDRRFPTPQRRRNCSETYTGAERVLATGDVSPGRLRPTVAKQSCSAGRGGGSPKAASAKNLQLVGSHGILSQKGLSVRFRKKLWPADTHRAALPGQKNHRAPPPDPNRHRVL